MFYRIFIRVSLGCSRFVIILIVIEILSWAFVLLMRQNQLKYLIIQTLFLLLSLTILIRNKVLFLLLVSFLLKMGLPPFHLWMTNIFSSLKNRGAVFMLTLHKVIPLLVLSKVVSLFNVVALGSLLFLSNLILVLQRRLVMILLVSSMAHSYWMIIRLTLGVWLFLIYWLCYRILTRILIRPVFMKKNWQTNRSSLLMTALIILAGVPPFLIFWIKIRLLTELASLRQVVMLLALVASLLALASYLRGGFNLSSVKSSSLNGKAKYWPLLLSMGANGVIR